MTAMVMAAFGALVGAGLLGAVYSLMGIRLFSRAGRGLRSVQVTSQRLTLWVLGAFVAAVATWAITRWPVGGMWAFVGVLSFPLLRSQGPKASTQIDKVEAIATWTEQIRDTMSASAGLQQSLIATSQNGPAVIRPELAAFARRAPRGDLGGALQQLGADLNHPSADLVIAGLLSATDLDAGRLAPLLSRLATAIRQDAQMRIRVEVSRARVRTSMVIVGFFVALTMLLMIVVGRELLSGYRSMAGQLWLLVVGSVVVIAIWSTRKLAQVPLPERFVARRNLT